MDEQTTHGRAEGDVDRLVHEKFFGDNRAGQVCIEVGAARPDFLSIGNYFRALGWRVMSIEPNPEFCSMHRSAGHEILEYACGDTDRDGADFFVVDSHGVEYGGGHVSFESFSSLGIRGAWADLAEGCGLEIEKIPVKVRRLDTILRTHAPEVCRIDLLAIDVEGWEIEVLRGLNCARYRPRVMIIENNFSEQRYRDCMNDLGYDLWQTFAPNDVYVRRERWAAKIVRRLGRLMRLDHAHADLNKPAELF